MATTTHKTVWELEHKQYLKRLKEIAKAEKEVTDASAKALKAGDKDQGKSLKAYEDSMKRKLSLHKEHDKAMKSANSFQLKSNKNEMEFLKNSDKHKAKAHKLALSRVKQVSKATVKGLATATGAALKTGFAVGGAGLGMLVGASVQGYQRHMQYQQTLAGMSGMGSGRQVHRGMRRRMGASLGYNVVESAQHGAQMGKATGITGPREMQQAMRATGMGAGEVGGIYGAFARGGIGFEGAGGDVAGVKKGQQSKGGREFQRMISAGMESGLKRGRLPEFFQGVTKLMQEQQRVQVGEIGAADYSKTLALWGKTGLAGMQGMRGAGILQQINQGIKKPGGGEGGKALMMQAMGFGKPGGGTSFYEAEKSREKGATGGNMMKVMSELQGQFGTGQEAALTMREVFGVSLEQAEELLKIYDSSANAEDKLKAIDEKMEKSKSLEEQSRDYLRKTASGAVRLAARFDESVDHGRDAAKYIEKVEDWQYKLVGLMFRMVEVLENIFEEVSMLTNAFGSGKDVKAAMIIAKGEQAHRNMITADTTRQQAAALGLATNAAGELVNRDTKEGYGRASIRRAMGGTDQNKFLAETNATEGGLETYAQTIARANADMFIKLNKITDPKKQAEIRLSAKMKARTGSARAAIGRADQNKLEETTIGGTWWGASLDAMSTVTGGRIGGGSRDPDRVKGTAGGAAEIGKGAAVEAINEYFNMEVLGAIKAQTARIEHTDPGVKPGTGSNVVVNPTSPNGN